MLGEFIAPTGTSGPIATKYTRRQAGPGFPHRQQPQEHAFSPSRRACRGLRPITSTILLGALRDALTPMEESLRGLDDLVRTGKIHYAALSNFPGVALSPGRVLAEVSRVRAD